VSEKRDRLGPPPVEPLSDVSWQRVEKRLFAQLDLDGTMPDTPVVRPRRSWAPWAFAGGLALAAAAAVAVVVTRPAEPSHVAHVRDAGVPSPSRVVAQDSPTEVSFGEAQITVDAESAVTMHGNAAAGVLIVLERGAASFAVAPRQERPPFIVQAGEVTVRVIGTRFKVSRSGDAARVDVIEGHVEVVARGRRVQVRAGESWSSSDDREAVVRDPATSPGGIAAAPYFQEGQPLGGGQPGDFRSSDGTVNDGLPREGQPSAGAATTTPDRTTRSRPRQRTSRLDETDRARYERAAALEATDARGALRAYRGIARGKGPWAANALYAAGRLAAELGEDEIAAITLRGYIARFPHGANVSDARALLQSLEQ